MNTSLSPVSLAYDDGETVRVVSWDIHKQSLEAALRGRVVGEWPDWSEAAVIHGQLLPQDDNEHDENAIKVMLEDTRGTLHHVGFLPGSEAYLYRPHLDLLRRAGRVGQVTVHVLRWPAKYGRSDACMEVLVNRPERCLPAGSTRIERPAPPNTQAPGPAPAPTQVPASAPAPTPAFTAPPTPGPLQPSAVITPGPRYVPAPRRARDSRGRFVAQTLTTPRPRALPSQPRRRRLPILLLLALWTVQYLLVAPFLIAFWFYFAIAAVFVAPWRRPCLDAGRWIIWPWGI